MEVVILWRIHRICIANKTEGINLNVFNVITIVNDSKILTKYTSCKRKCKFDDRKCDSNQKRNNNKC